MSLKRGGLLLAVLLLFSSLVGRAASASEPVYRQVRLQMFNYLPLQIGRVAIKDQYGNRADGGVMLFPGADGVDPHCCYTLKGTDFTLEWDNYDLSAAFKDDKTPITKSTRTARFHLPDDGMARLEQEKFLALHFYPDGHVEPEIDTTELRARFDFIGVQMQLEKDYGDQISPGGKPVPRDLLETVARISGQAWKKYRLSNTDDLEQYVRYALLVHPDFDRAAEVQKILKLTRPRPGAFAFGMQDLPQRVVEDIKRLPRSTQGKEAAR